MDGYRHYRMALRNLSLTWALYLVYDGTQENSSIDYVLTRMAPPADDRPLPEVNAGNVVALVRHRSLPDLDGDPWDFHHPTSDLDRPYVETAHANDA